MTSPLRKWTARLSAVCTTWAAVITLPSPEISTPEPSPPTVTTTPGSAGSASRPSVSITTTEDLTRWNTCGIFFLAARTVPVVAHSSRAIVGQSRRRIGVTPRLPARGQATAAALPAPRGRSTGSLQDRHRHPPRPKPSRTAAKWRKAAEPVRTRGLGDDRNRPALTRLELHHRGQGHADRLVVRRWSVQTADRAEVPRASETRQHRGQPTQTVGVVRVEVGRLGTAPLVAEEM